VDITHALSVVYSTVSVRLSDSCPVVVPFLLFLSQVAIPSAESTKLD
jgi:hypothetical protein